MDVIGIDFTSSPSRRKPIVAQYLVLEDKVLQATTVEFWTSFIGFEDALQRLGPWIAAIDFPFGLSRRFIDNTGWPKTWASYVEHAKQLGRHGFYDALTEYRRGRSMGDKEHRRATDKAAKSTSPQKLHGVPVGLMFFEGAQRILPSPASIPILKTGDADRVIVEAYPGILARRLIGRRSYKNDAKAKQTAALLEARQAVFARLIETARDRYGFSIEAPTEVCDDPSGDRLDALICGVQGAWAWSKRRENFGLPLDADPLEGWIADPHALP